MDAPAEAVVFRERPAVDNDSLNALFRTVWPDHADRDHAPILAKSASYVLAYDGERVIGYVNVATDGGEHAFLLDPTVDPQFRHRGIGTSLVRLATDAAARRGCRWLHVDFLPELAPFYERTGFRATAAGLIELSRPVEAPVELPPVASPFDVLRARGLIIQCVIGAIAVIALVRFLMYLVPELDSPLTPGPETMALLYLGVGFVIAGRILAAKLDVRRLFGPPPTPRLLQLTVVAVPLGVLSLAGFWLLFLPLSFAVPNFVRSHALESQALRAPASMASWAGLFMVAVIVAPVVEEVFFRGLLFQRWSRRWGTPVAAVLSSALFAVGHVEVIGHFVFGMVMCALYLRTRSLWLPMATHALNNLLASLGTLPSAVASSTKAQDMTLASFRSGWWVGLLLLVLGAILLEAYRRSYWADVDLRALFRGPVPYST